MQSEKRNLLFEPVTDPELIKYTHLQNGRTWRPEFLSMEDYTKREHLLGTCEISSTNKCQEMQKRFPEGSELLGIKYFVLKDLNLPQTSKTSQIVSSCETLNRVGWAVTPGSKGAIKPVLSACIGGVFTIPEFRAKRFGAELITRLNEYYDGISKAPGAPEFVQNIVIFLYSEVGEYYSKFGYVSRPIPVHTVEKLDAVLELYCGGNSDSDSASAEGRNIGFDCDEHFIELEKQSFVKDVQNAHSSRENAFVFTLEPSKDIFKWFHHRSLYHKKFLDPASPSRFGYALADGSHIVWHLNYWPHQRSLYILKLYLEGDTVAKKEASLKKLLAQAIQEAQEHEVKYLQFWDTELGQQDWSKPFMKFLQKVEEPSNLYQENSSRSAIRVANVKAEDIEWRNNAKFCWF
ncbi:LAME_0H17678g1_1 [Lachancea meyersii CBS 8951]|uniref:LAME_0H17678g1_1 n=1 Tax=Lachancea meyersii CBS 8951 TaxID=1266667 RepID=A0A1G4KIR3_9SACH|nr:LAME_0H17678g1_1 [Lachancea meyersii CBS 8951]